MKSLAASVVALAILAPAAAYADTYVGVGIGTGASVDGDLTGYDSNGQHSGRLVIGDKFGLISIEGGVSGFGLTTSGGANQWDARSLGAAAKLSLPIVPLIDGYVRLGLERTWLSVAGGDGTRDLVGDGWTGGLGAEYHFAKFSVWADYSKHTMTFPAGHGQIEGAAAMLTLGASINF